MIPSWLFLICSLVVGVHAATPRCGSSPNNTLLADANDIQSFYHCLNGELIKFHCGVNHVFDPYARACVNISALTIEQIERRKRDVVEKIKKFFYKQNDTHTEVAENTEDTEISTRIDNRKKKRTITYITDILKCIFKETVGSYIFNDVFTRRSDNNNDIALETDVSGRIDDDEKSVIAFVLALLKIVGGLSDQRQNVVKHVSKRGASDVPLDRDSAKLSLGLSVGDNYVNLDVTKPLNGPQTVGSTKEVPVENSSEKYEYSMTEPANVVKSNGLISIKIRKKRHIYDLGRFVNDAVDYIKDGIKNFQAKLDKCIQNE